MRRYRVQIDRKENRQQISKHISNIQHGIDFSIEERRGGSIKLSPQTSKISRVSTREHVEGHPTLSEIIIRI